MTIRQLAVYSGAVIAGLLSLPETLIGQQPSSREPTEDRSLASLDWLVGEWQGYGIFPDDTTFIHKRFRYVLAGRFLLEETVDVFPPAEPTTEYQLHQDRLFYYATSEGLAAKGFFVEGFVWNAAVTVRGDTVQVVTESVEAGPPGLEARVTMVRTGPDGSRATFDLRSAGGAFRTFETLTMRRLTGR